jgi:hypothetical protein
MVCQWQKILRGHVRKFSRKPLFNHELINDYPINHELLNDVLSCLWL